MNAQRPASLLLTIQVVALVILTIALCAWVWNAADVQASTIEPPRNAYANLMRQSARLEVTPYRFASTREPALVDDTRDAKAQADAALDIIEPGVSDSRKIVGRVRRAMIHVQEASGLFYNSGPQADLSAAFEELSIARTELSEATTALGVAVEAHGDLYQKRTLSGLLILTGLMLSLALSTSLVARGRLSRSTTGERHLLDTAVSALSDALRRSVEGREPAALPKHDALTPAVDAASRAITAVDELRRAQVRIERCQHFTRDLIDALSLAEDERQIGDATIRGGRTAYPEGVVQILNVDAAEGTIRKHDVNRTSACDLMTAGACPALERRRTLVHGHEHNASRCPRLTESALTVACAPVSVNGTQSAVVQIIGYDERTARTEELEAMALALGSRLSAHKAEIKRIENESTDPATGLANRRLLDLRLQQASLTDEPYAILTIDVDHLGDLNLRYGREVGDRCLTALTSALRVACRQSDLPVRLGEDDFVIFLPKANFRSGITVAMRVRSALAELLARRSEPPFTVSIGVATQPEHGSSGQTVLRAAEAALFDAKEAGRDQVVPARHQSSLDITH